MSWELNIPAPVGRNLRTGRFVKGRTPFNKGKKWDEYMSQRSRKRAAKGWKNLKKYRPERSDRAGAPKKKVIMLDDKGLYREFESLHAAARWLKHKPESIGNCCRANQSCTVLKRDWGRGRRGCNEYVNTDHKYMGYRWYFETDRQWIDKLGIDINQKARTMTPNFTFIPPPPRGYVLELAEEFGTDKLLIKRALRDMSFSKRSAEIKFSYYKKHTEPYLIECGLIQAPRTSVFNYIYLPPPETGYVHKLAEEMGVSRPTVSAALTGKTYTEISAKIRYAYYERYVKPYLAEAGLIRTT